MREYRGRAFRTLVAASALTAGLGSAYGRERPMGPQFKYVGGTESLPAGCEGTLELSAASLGFKCDLGPVSIPYSSITLMQYRSDVSQEVRKRKLKWAVRPPSGGRGRNHYFSVMFSEGSRTHAIILDVRPEAMRPYLAEIDLKSGKRVEVQSHEGYE